eukprot:GHVS01048006.1.p1 GENE.GHVS01048006.1~~GHVS01048006.1.p1  ORF type:complete len:439 (-),score=83.23 GHVS01048006.1:409-1725(-)
MESFRRKRLKIGGKFVREESGLSPPPPSTRQQTCDGTNMEERRKTRSKDDEVDGGAKSFVCSRSPPPPSSRPPPSLTLPSADKSIDASSANVFVEKRVALSQLWYQEFNNRVFRRHLPSSLHIEWDSSLTSTAGHCTVFKFPCKCKDVSARSPNGRPLNEDQREHDNCTRDIGGNLSGVGGPCVSGIRHWLECQAQRKGKSHSVEIQTPVDPMGESDDGRENNKQQVETEGQQIDPTKRIIKQQMDDSCCICIGVNKQNYICGGGISPIKKQLPSCICCSSASIGGISLLPVSLRPSVCRFPDGHWGSISIKLSSNLLTNCFRMCQTLLHEICHAAQFYFEPSTIHAPAVEHICSSCQQQPNIPTEGASERTSSVREEGNNKSVYALTQSVYVDRRPHGPAFWKYAKIASLLYPTLEVSRCHSYDVQKRKSRRRCAYS